MFFRAVVPRAAEYMRCLRGPVRLYCRRRGPDRDLPIFSPWRRRRTEWPDDSFFPASPGDAFHRFEKMFQRMAEDMFPRNLDAYYIRPRTEGPIPRSEVAEVKLNKNVFEVKLDVQNYAPENLNVKIANGRLSVSGKHEQKADEHGYISREFHRELDIPQEVDAETITCNLSEEGYLTLRGKIKGAEPDPERTIEIQKEEKGEKQS